MHMGVQQLDIFAPFFENLHQFRDAAGGTLTNNLFGGGRFYFVISAYVPRNLFYVHKDISIMIFFLKKKTKPIRFLYEKKKFFFFFRPMQNSPMIRAQNPTSSRREVLPLNSHIPNLSPLPPLAPNTTLFPA